MSSVAVVAQNVPERHYTHHAGRGETPMRSNPLVIHRDLTTLEVAPGMRTCEIGTGSGYSGGLLAALVGPSGTVTSLDIDPYLVQWAAIAHKEVGIDNVTCVAADGAGGFQADAPYDRLVAWCTPPLLPAPWVDQVTDGGIIVTALPIAALPHLTVVAKIRVTGGQPEVEAITSGGYMETTSAPIDAEVPTRWVDWEYRVPDSSWISIAWRDQDDQRHTSARATLDLLRARTYTEPYAGNPIDWTSWRTWTAATSDPHLTMAALATDCCAIGHATHTAAAVVQQDGLIVADRPDSPSLVVLRGWLAAWENAGRPSPASYSPTLTGHSEHSFEGWNLRLVR